MEKAQQESHIAKAHGRAATQRKPLRFFVSLRPGVRYALPIAALALALLLALLLALGMGLMRWSRAAAQEATPAVDTSQISDDQVNAIAKTLYCPVCENIPLDVCGTQACAQWRELIRLRLAEGWTAEQIRQYFALNYGDRVLAEPPRRGLNWLVYLLPPLAFLVGVYLVYRVLRTARRAAQPAGIAAGEPLEASDPYLAQIEEELKRR